MSYIFLNPIKKCLREQSQIDIESVIVLLFILSHPLRYISGALFNELLGIEGVNIFLPIILLIGITSFIKLSKDQFQYKVNTNATWIIPIVFLFATTIIINLYSLEEPNSWLRSIFLDLYIPTVLLFIRIDSTKINKYIDPLLKIFVFISIFLIIYKIFIFQSRFDLIFARQYLAFGNSIPTTLSIENQVANSITDARIMGVILLLIWLNIKLNSLIKVILSIPPLGFILLLGNRQSIVAFILVLLFFAGKPLFKIIVTISILISFYIAQLINNYFLDNSVIIFDRGIESQGRTQLLSYYGEAVSESLTNINLLGEGIGGFSRNFVSNHFPYPHNIFVELIYDFGIISFALFSIITAIFILHSYLHFNNIKANPIKKYIVSLTWFHLIIAQFSGNLKLNMMLMSLYIFYFTFCLTTKNLYKRRHVY